MHLDSLTEHNPATLGGRIEGRCETNSSEHCGRLPSIELSLCFVDEDISNSPAPNCLPGVSTHLAHAPWRPTFLVISFST
jgi:hypothetical protein